MGTDSKEPWGLQWRSNTNFILATVGIGLFTDLFLYGLIVPILPFMLEDRIHVDPSDIQTYTSTLLAVYAGSSVLFSLPAGIIADKLPARQLPFLFGLIALLGATVMLYLGQSIAVLIVARILQGISAAIVWTIGLAMVLDTVGSGALGATIGTIFSITSVGELAAPVLGGVMYKKAGSAGVFGMAFGILGLDVIMRLLIIEKKTAAKYLDDEAIADAPEDVERGGDDAQDENSPLFPNGKTDEGEWEIRSDLPEFIKKFPILYCFSNSRILTAEAVAFTQAILLAVFDATVPTEAQALFDVDSLRAGLLFVPLVLPYLLLGTTVGKGVDKYGTKPAAVIGFAFLIIPFTLLRIPQPGGTTEMVKFCALLAMCGIGLAFLSAPSIVEASWVIKRYHESNKGLFGEQGPYAQLYAINSMVFSAGLTLGPPLAGVLREGIGYGNMNAVVAGLCAAISILSFVYLGGTPKVLMRRS